jgi:hypothetical protein
MHFTGSKLLEKLRSPAPAEAIEKEVRALATMLGVADDATIKDLASTETTHEALLRLRF